MKASVLLHLLFQVVLLFDALGWEVKMPKDIHGLKGSCLVIPCSFSYTSNPPKNPHRIVWYQWVSMNYPLVFDPSSSNSVIEKFRGKTDLYGTSRWDCSLLIKKLELSHHGERLYAWIDPENVGKRTYAFYDITSTIRVDTHPQLPNISISGGQKMGEMITVTCSTSHTCPYSKPNITLKGFEGSDQTDHDCDTKGQCRITLTRTGVIKAVNSTIECSVTHYGDIHATASENKSALYSALYELKTTGLYVLTPLLALLLTCALAGFIIHKKRQRPKDASTASENKPSTNPHISLPVSELNLNSYFAEDNCCDVENTNIDAFTIYENYC